MWITLYNGMHCIKVQDSMSFSKATTFKSAFVYSNFFGKTFNELNNCMLLNNWTLEKYFYRSQTCFHSCQKWNMLLPSANQIWGVKLPCKIQNKYADVFCYIRSLGRVSWAPGWVGSSSTEPARSRTCSLASPPHQHRHGQLWRSQPPGTNKRFLWLFYAIWIRIPFPL